MIPSSRSPIGYVVQIDGQRATLNVLDSHKGQVAAHASGISTVTEIGSLLGLDAGQRILVFRVTGLSFAEPKAAHDLVQQVRKDATEPLRFVYGYIVGKLEAKSNRIEFVADYLATPALGAAAFPLSAAESAEVIGARADRGPLTIGTEVRTRCQLRVGLNSFLSRHVAVLGASGQGKSCFTAAILQQLVDMPGSRIVIFDLNGEYERAFYLSEQAIAAGNQRRKLEPPKLKLTRIGPGSDGFKIPYYALGRQGLYRLLMPSEKTQRPALSFALDKLHFVKWDSMREGLSLETGDAVLFSDCRQDGAQEGYEAIQKLRDTVSLSPVGHWPHMSSLAVLVAESNSLVPGRNGRPERSAFHYSNVAPLVTRIERFVDDPMFSAVVDVNGGEPAQQALSWKTESEALVDRVFGSRKSEWQVHILNMREIPHDLMPFILGALLELYAQVLFARGQGNNPPTLLVLEEAHHYLRSVTEDGDNREAVAYERLAKEGRKFGLALWLSTQRPAEVSPTVLSQCNNWVVFRLNTERDQKMVMSASEWADPREVYRLGALPRQHALVFGGAVEIPTYVKAAQADPTPESQDGDFDSWQCTRNSDAR